MDTEPDEQLKTQFLSLLIKADPNIAKRQALAEEFAGQLAAFTKEWAIGAKNIEEKQEAIREWIASNVAKAGARPKVKGAAAGACGSGARRRPSKKR